jgi:hypothetical protein
MTWCSGECEVSGEAKNKVRRITSGLFDRNTSVSYLDHLPSYQTGIDTHKTSYSSLHIVRLVPANQSVCEKQAAESTADVRVLWANIHRR